jgi:aminoglycoside phosphotransferase (APT) family kinase protein
VIETPFYLMEFLDGRILEDISLTGVAPAERTSLWRAAVHNLAKLHSIDFRKIGLDSYGKSDRFYDRQLTTWKQISAVSRRLSCMKISNIFNADTTADFLTTPEPKQGDICRLQAAHWANPSLQ